MKGSCLCGGVEFAVEGPARAAIACHCTQCRKQSGHFWAASSIPVSGFHLVESATLAWFSASDAAKRGFCTGCGAFLFWQAEGRDEISFAVGAIDGPTGLHIAAHWHEADAGDYYHGPSGAAERLHGSCLCGANRFSLPGPMGEVWGCHCLQCRKTSGHFSASFDADPATIVWEARLTTDHIGPNGGTRSFCAHCGSGLTFDGATEFSIEAGCIDNPTGGHLARHIFVAAKGDYYDLTDGLPQHEGSWHGANHAS
jgi:hypothetical protein